MAEARNPVPLSLRELLTGIIDYAGLFPPAQLPMAAAVSNYAQYRSGPYAWMLGRFVVPVSRLAEFESESSQLLPRGDGFQPWLLSALVGADPAADSARMLDFNGSHAPASDRGHAMIDVAELKVEKPAQVRDLHERLGAGFEAFLEFPLAIDPAPFVDALAEAGAGAKARTGGITPDAFPSAERIARFLEACVSRRVRFKVTAGLHHLIRGNYRLTYEENSPCGTMFGYLNVFVAAATLVAGRPRADAVDVLNTASLDTLTFGDDDMRWGERTLDLSVLRETRRLARAFGSCSFTEPVDELVAGGLLS